jgi:hypothetical protein
MSCPTSCHHLGDKVWTKIKETKYYLLYGFFFLGTVIVGSLIADQYRTGLAYSSKSEECPMINASAQTTITKEIWQQWHWTYSGSGYSLVQVCPTWNHDSKLYAHGHLASRSDKKTFSTSSKTHINDCHGKRIYNTETSNFGQTLINLNGILVSLVVRDPDDNILGYVASTNFYSQEIQLIDYKTGQVVVEMNKNFFDIPWNWVTKVYDLTNPLADPRLTSHLEGQLSFSPQPGDKDSTDMCNNFFKYGSLTVIILTAILGFIGLIWLIYFTRKIVGCCQRCLRRSQDSCQEHDCSRLVTCAEVPLRCCVKCGDKIDETGCVPPDGDDEDNDKNREMNYISSYDELSRRA